MAAMQRQPGEDSSNKNFYNGMLIASIIAAIALLALIIVLALYLKRTTTYKAIISGGKKSEYAFSNKAFTTVSLHSKHFRLTLIKHFSIFVFLICNCAFVCHYRIMSEEENLQFPNREQYLKMDLIVSN